MSSSDEPFRPPAADMRRPPRPAAAGSVAITPGMIQSLTRTRPWVIFLGVLGMIGCAFMVLGGLFMVVGGIAGMSGLEGMEEGFGAIGFGAMGALYLFLALFYFFPSLYLIRYGIAIGRMAGQANAVAMEEALGLQCSVWRFIGIATALIMGLYVLIIVGAVGVGIFSAMG